MSCLIRNGFCAFVVTLATMCHSSVQAAKLELVSWPLQRTFGPMMPLQFGVLRFDLPIAQVRNVLVLNSEMGGMHIFSAGEEANSSVLLGSRSYERFMGRFAERGFLKDPHASGQKFFDSLASAEDTDPGTKYLRQILHIGAATRLLKATRGELHAYAVQSTAPNFDTIYLVVDGDETIYEVMGPVSPHMFDLLLSNMRVAPIP